MYLFFYWLFFYLSLAKKVIYLWISCIFIVYFSNCFSRELIFWLFSLIFWSIGFKSIFFLSNSCSIALISSWTSSITLFNYFSPYFICLILSLLYKILFFNIKWSKASILNLMSNWTVLFLTFSSILSNIFFLTFELIFNSSLLIDFSMYYFSASPIAYFS